MKQLIERWSGIVFGWAVDSGLMVVFSSLKNVQVKWKSVEVLQKVKNRATLWFSNCTTRHLPKGYRNVDSERHVHPDVYSSKVSNSRNRERDPMCIDWLMDKEILVYT